MCKPRTTWQLTISYRILEVLEESGCEYTAEFYRKPEVVSEMETALSKTIEESLIAELNKSPFIGVILDETCDISIQKKLVIILQCIGLTIV